MWIQKRLQLSARDRGFHLITDELLRGFKELANYRVGVLHIFVQHTSASLSVNENADPDVRFDLERYFNRIAPENAPYYAHTFEGSDDMPAHIKTVLIGNSLSLPVTNGELALGAWQGVYLCEHRDHGGARTIVVTLQGECFD